MQGQRYHIRHVGVQHVYGHLQEVLTELGFVARQTGS